ncbi:winged helix DNA-binding domain-containing protein [Coprinopsis marcescibilis]|uniref:Winged helix DNA-binding domain-containing protein n=1 Tax=Coprinopsis marcescibilis TaxID=230819 RepID=A0A5C3KJ61_COPMA|nr:winged helix DNA-binding domain-containing protein [Coprinopsis marcescibilis]
MSSRMINDPKSAHFISWTELGTSFVVSNVGEFSRSILGSHFKHNNFSSFVRQLNMYGFHKINRTPRAQRTSTDAQTWEFSHHKFLRGRPDLLDEIKRKALEPDPALKHRVELPGEVSFLFLLWAFGGVCFRVRCASCDLARAPIRISDFRHILRAYERL